MKLFVVTRFGLGQRSDNFFRANLPLLENLLLPSLAAQTDSRFTWLVLIDKRAPRWVIQRFEQLGKGCPQLRVFSHDPFSNFDLMPDVPALLGQNGVEVDDYVLSARVDADDALAVNYVESIRARAEKLASGQQRADCAFITASGALLLIRSVRFLKISKKNYSVVAVGSTYGPGFKHCHSYPHSQMWRGFPGLATVEVESIKPQWLRVLRNGSVHRSYRGFRVSDFIDYFPNLKVLVSKFRFRFVSGHTDRIERAGPTDELPAQFGIDVAMVAKAAKESRRWRSSSIPKNIFSTYQPPGDASLPQLKLKSKILRRFRDIYNSEAASTAGKNRLNQLAEDFYSF